MIQECIIESIELQHFRCFGALQTSFHPRMTALVAPNGGGKTAVIDAIAIALRLFVETMESTSTAKGFDIHDIQQIVTTERAMELAGSVQLVAQGRWFGTPVHWKRQRATTPAARTTTADAQHLRDIAVALLQQHLRSRQNPQISPPTFPLIASYGTGRLWSVAKLTAGRKADSTAPNGRTAGYIECLSASSHYKAFLDWFRRFSYEALQEQSSQRESPQHPEAALAGVRRAVDLVLEPVGWHTLEWDFTEDTVRAQHPTFGYLPVRLLSDGIRNVIGLVADIAHRAVRLNRHFGADSAIRTPGIVLIDEIDMHLHPEWQQLILPSLQRAFPLVQFIVTTHSPQVLTSIPAECIRMLHHHENGVWLSRQPSAQTKGVESTAVLAEVMGTDPIPDVAEARWLQDYRSLIQQHLHTTPQGLALRQQLEAHFGADHLLMRECDRLIRLEAFKRTLTQSER